MGAFSISPSELFARIGTADAPLIFDVCKCEDYDQLPRLIPGARWRDHQRTDAWMNEISRGSQVVLSCVKGMKVSQAAAAELRLRGVDATILEGGSVAWVAGEFRSPQERRRVRHFLLRTSAVPVERNGVAIELYRLGPVAGMQFEQR